MSAFKTIIGILTWGMLFTLSTAADSAWALTFEDEFEGVGIPDESKWNRPEYNRRDNDAGPDGWWLQEDSFLDGKGNLVITCRKIDDRNGDGDAFDYSTGAVRTRGHFEQAFGRYEVRARLPNQPGWWIAFWLMSPGVGHVDGSGEDGTEIDIMEGFGWTDRINQALHWDGYGSAHQSEGHSAYVSGDLDIFHTYALEWSPEEYVFFVDDEETWRTGAGGVSKVPAYVKITGEISTESWAINEYWSNDPAGAAYPDSFLVDWVRVYEWGEVSAVRHIPVAVEGPAAKIYMAPGGGLDMELGLSERSNLRITMVDGQGRTVAETAVPGMGPGISKYHWDPKDTHGATVPAGAYSVCISAGGNRSVHPLAVVY